LPKIEIIFGILIKGEVDIQLENLEVQVFEND
jgi:hypothetical protein